ncbi:MAG: restriction endonuclease subunit S [Ignavibacteriaceae bacterium]|nr:restriction endonuclease subunit S [Ignavibacteriaceae bacterium]
MSFEVFKIKELCQFKYGKSLPERERISGDYPVFGSAGIVGTHNEYLLKAPGIIVGRKGTVGSVNWTNKNFFPIDTAFYIVEDKAKVDLKFLYYRLLLAGLETMNNDAAVPGLNRTAALNHRITVPTDITTQIKIASLLSTYDDLIETNFQKINLLEETAQITFNEWFLKEKSLHNGLAKKILKDVAAITMGQSPESKYYNEEKIGLPFHQGVTGYGFRFPENETWSSEGTRVAVKGDILFSVRAPVGRLNIAIEKIILGRGLGAFRHKKGWNSFLYYQLRKLFFKEDLMGGGAIFSSVTKTDVEKIKIVEADEKSMIKFNDFAKPIDNLIENLTHQNRLLKEARDILLPRLMTGMIEV